MSAESISLHRYRFCLRTVGADFEGSEVSVTFPAQAFEECAFISIADDNIVEGTEFFTITAGGGVFPNGNSENVTILDNDGEDKEAGRIADFD